jgi:serine protease Do
MKAALSTALFVLALPALAPAGDGDIPEIIERVSPSVVSIYSTRTALPGPLPRFFPFDPFDLTPRPQRGVGSGVIAAADGLILTNAHVVDRANDIRVVLPDRREFKAKVVGADRPTDVALLRIEARNLPTAALGDSSKARVGETVLAIGNPLGMGQTVSRGILSAKGRANVGIADYEDFLQTDAAINPGNSGGPLVNLKGEVIGLNTAIASRTGGFQGIGFAIPINMAREVLQILLDHGKVSRGHLGILAQDMTPQLARAIGGAPARGALISDVLEKGAAQEAGLRRGDVILKLDGEPIASVSELRNRVALRGVNAEVKVEVWREQKTFEARVRLQELDSRESHAAEEEPPTDGEDDADSTSGIDGVNVTPATPGLLRYLGLPRTMRGLVVMEVSPAASVTGLRAGDFILEVNRKPVATIAEMEQAAKESREVVLLTVRRREGTIYITVPK